ncbi:MAG: type II toxin-antitoxin system HicB family antitoxin [Tepidiformaceae bacterium]
MRMEFTAIIEPADEGGFWAICPEVPGANGQGETIEEVKEDLEAAIKLMLDVMREDALKRASPTARHETLTPA